MNNGRNVSGILFGICSKFGDLNLPRYLLKTDERFRMKSSFAKKILLLVFFFILIAVNGANLVVNPDFTQSNEKGNPVGWFGRVDPGSGVDREVTPGNGKNSYRIVGNKMIEQNVKIKPDTVYKFSYLLKQKDLNG